MKKNGIKTLYRLFSFLSDFTNGFKPFVKYKLILGSLLIGLATTSCKTRPAAETDTTKKDELTATSCKTKPATETNIMENDEPEEQPLCYISDISSVSEKNMLVSVNILCYDSVVSYENNTAQKKNTIASEETKTVPSETEDYGIEITCYVTDALIMEYEKEEKEKIYVGVEIPPSFPGGEKELMKYVRDSLRYPVGAEESEMQGRVVVRFVVNKQGEATDVEILRSLHPAYDKEAIRIIESMPRWTSGKHNGEVVNVYYTLPVVFKLQ